MKALLSFSLLALLFSQALPSRAEGTVLPLDEISAEQAAKLAKDEEVLASDPNKSIGNFDKAITINEIQVAGNQMIPTEVIMQNIKSREGSRFSRRKIAFDLKSLNEMGYFDKNKLLAIPIPQGEEGVILRIQVVENAPVTGLIVSGTDVLDKAQIEEFLTPLVGLPRSTVQIKSAVDMIEKVYHEKGYMLAAVTELHFDPDGFLTVSVDEGKISELQFEGNERTQESYLRKIAPKDFTEGKPYNEEQVAKFMEGLKRSGFFKDVTREIKPNPEDPSKHILSFKIEEQRTKQLSLGTGLGTQNGFFGQVGFTEPHFRGQGETLSANVTAGTGLLTALDGDNGGRFARRGDFRFNVSYADPFIGDSDKSFSASSSAFQQGSFLVDSSIQRTLKGGVTFGMPVPKRDDWFFTVGLLGSTNNMISAGTAAQDQLQRSLVERGRSQANALTEAQGLRRNQLQDGFYLDITPSLVYRKIDDAGTGWRNTFFAGPSVGSAGSYASAGVDLRRYESLTDDGWMFKNAFHAESLLGDPAGFRLLKAGGPYGVRGYRQFTDVGVGSTSVSNTFEFSMPITIPKAPLKDVKLALFSDLGLVAGESFLNGLYDRRSVLASVGIGLEINIPLVGPLRIDYGIPLLRNDNRSFFSGRVTINPGNQL